MEPAQNQVDMENGAAAIERDPSYESQKTVVYRSYPQRWVVLITVCLLALSNATVNDRITESIQNP